MELGNINSLEIPLDFSSGNGPVNGGNPDVQQSIAPQQQPAISEAELAYRAMQSERDQFQAKYLKASKAEEILESIAKDQEFRRSLLSEYEPDVFKAPNPTLFIKENLVKEFGEDFETILESGSSFQKLELQTRYQELKNLAGKTYTAPKPFKDLVADRQKISDDANAAFIAEINQVRQKHQMSDNEWKGFEGWSQKLNTDFLVGSYLKAIRTGNKPQPPGFLTVPGNSNNKPSEFDELSKTFGNPQRTFEPGMF